MEGMWLRRWRGMRQHFVVKATGAALCGAIPHPGKHWFRDEHLPACPKCDDLWKAGPAVNLPTAQKEQKRKQALNLLLEELRESKQAQRFLQEFEQCLAEGRAQMEGNLTLDQIAISMSEQDMLLFFCQKLAEAGHLTPLLQEVLGRFLEICSQNGKENKR